MKKFIALFLALACLLAVSSVAFADASIVRTHVYGEKIDTSDSMFTMNAYQLHLYDDGTYMMIKTTCSYGFSMQLGTAAVTTFGTYENGASEDGWMDVKLSEATRVVLNSYSKMGGFDICIDTELTDFSGQVELPAQVQGEKNYASSAADVIAAYGAEMTIYVATDAAVSAFSMTNPNE